jgi:hypothetical protein
MAEFLIPFNGPQMKVPSLLVEVEKRKSYIKAQKRRLLMVPLALSVSYTQMNCTCSIKLYDYFARKDQLLLLTDKSDSKHDVANLRSIFLPQRYSRYSLTSI